MAKVIPISNIGDVYFYFLRNIKLNSINGICEYCRFVSAINKTIQSSHVSAHFYQKTANEMERYGLIKKLNRKFIKVMKNDDIDRRIDELKNYNFPL